MAEPSGYSCSSSSEDDEYLDPLEVEAALEETVETSVMLRYNDNKRT